MASSHEFWERIKRIKVTGDLGERESPISIIYRRMMTFGSVEKHLMGIRIGKKTLINRKYVQGFKRGELTE